MGNLLMLINLHSIKIEASIFGIIDLHVTQARFYYSSSYSSINQYEVCLYLLVSSRTSFKSLVSYL